MGTNDCNPTSSSMNWTQHLLEFRSDYTEMIGLFRNSSSHPAVYAMVISPVCSDINDKNQTFCNEVLPVEIPQLAQAAGAKMGPNLNQVFLEHCPDFSKCNETCQLMSGEDGIHPN